MATEPLPVQPVNNKQETVRSRLKSGSRVSRSDGSSVSMVRPLLKALALFISHQLGEEEAPDQAGQPGSFFCSASEIKTHGYNGGGGVLGRKKKSTTCTQANWEKKNNKKIKDDCSCGSTACRTAISLTRDTLPHVVAPPRRLPTTLPNSLEDLELPGVLVLGVEAVHGGEAQLPGLLVLVVQAVDGGEAQRGGGAVALRGERGRRLAQRASHGGHGDGAEGAHRARQLGVHGRQVGAAVQAGEVGGGAGVALAVAGGLGVAHGVRGGPLHAGAGRGGGQRVGQRRDGRAPDGHGRVAGAGAQGQAGARLDRGRAVGARRVGDRVGSARLLRRGRLLLWGAGLRLPGALLLLLSAFSAAVFEPNLDVVGEKKDGERRCF